MKPRNHKDLEVALDLIDRWFDANARRHEPSRRAMSREMSQYVFGAATDITDACKRLERVVLLSARRCGRAFQAFPNFERMRMLALRGSIDDAPPAPLLAARLVMAFAHGRDDFARDLMCAFIAAASDDMRDTGEAVAGLSQAFTWITATYCQVQDARKQLSGLGEIGRNQS